MAKAGSLELFPEMEPSLTGIARLAAESPKADEGHLVEYHALAARSVLNESVSRRGLPFRWSINPYRGCEFACRYCYARYTHEFMELKKPEDFERMIFFKKNAAGLLERDLHKVAPGEAIGIGTATDPYQPLERRLELTRSLWEVFARWRGLRLGLVTKSALVTRDVELLQRVAARHDLTIHLTITTDDVGLARKLEPRAPRPDLRFETVKTLREAGLRAGVLCIPAMPGVNDSAKQLERMVKKAAAVEASFFSTGALFLKPCSKPVFMAFIAEHFPHLQGDYERRFARSAFLAGDYAREISRRVAMLCIEHGVSLRREATTDITTTPLGEVATIMEAIPAQKQTALPLRGFVPVSDLRRRAG